MVLLTVILGALALYILSYVSGLATNTRHARKIGLPYVVGPISTSNVLWMIFSVPWRGTFERVLPRAAWWRLRMLIYGWEFHQRFAVNEDMGGVFMVAMPSQLRLVVSEPQLTHDVLSRRKDFTTLPITKSALPYRRRQRWG